MVILNKYYEFILFSTGFIIALIAVPGMMRLAIAYGIVDTPAHRKIHKRPIPYLGGLAIAIGIALPLTAVLFFNPWCLNTTELFKLKILATVFGLATLCGLADDKYQLRAKYKFLGQILIASLFVILAYRVTALRIPAFEPFELNYLSVPLTVFWMVALANGLNLVDGVDGLAGTVAIAICLCTAFAASLLKDTVVVMVCTVAAGAIFAFLLFNWRAAKIYMGDSGSIGLGMLIAACLVSMGNNSASVPVWQAPSTENYLLQFPSMTVIAAYPALEVTLSVIRRMLTGKKISSADKGHIHHKLLNRGWSPQWISLTAGAISFLGGGIAISSLSNSRGFTTWLLMLFGTLVGLGLHYCGYVQSLHPETIRDRRPHFLIAMHFISMQKIKLGLAQSLGEIVALVDQTCVEFGVRDLKLCLSGLESGREDFKHEWRRSAAASQAYLTFLVSPDSTLKQGFSDHLELPGSTTHATWTFEPHEIEEDIDIEYRLLMHEFLQRALTAAEDIYNEGAQNISSADVSSMILKRKAALRRRVEDGVPKIAQES